MDELGGGPKLTHISVDFVRVLEDQYAGQLDSLDLSHNEISTIQNLGMLSTLTELDLSNNRLTSLDNLAELPLLRSLDVSCNLMSFLPRCCQRLAVTRLRAAAAWMA